MFELVFNDQASAPGVSGMGMAQLKKKGGGGEICKKDLRSYEMHC